MRTALDRRLKPIPEEFDQGVEFDEVVLSGEGGRIEYVHYKDRSVRICCPKDVIAGDILRMSKVAGGKCHD